MLNYFGVISLMPKNVANILTSTYSIFVVGGFESYGESYTQDRSIVRVNQDGSKDTSFNNQNKFSRGSDVKLVRTTPDSQVLMVSNNSTTTYGASTSWVHLVDASGNRNNTSNIYNISASIWSGINDITFDTSISSEHYGKAYVGFSSANIVVSGHTVSYIARFNSDWTIDTSFNTYLSSTQSGFNNNVLKIKILSDGNLIVGGNFTSYRGSSVTGTTGRLSKLQTNGNLVGSFNVGGVGFSGGSVNDIDEDSSGNLYVCGSFTGFNGVTNQSNSRLLKLSSTGTKNVTFSNPYPSGTVNQVIFDSTDNCIFVSSSYLNNSPLSNDNYGKGLAKLTTTTGVVKSGWTVPTYGLDSSGSNKIRFDILTNSLFLFGRASTYASYNRSGMMKFNGSTGQIDSSFSRNSRMLDIANLIFPKDFTIDINGKLIVVGNFNYFKSINYSGVKISPNGSIDNSLDVNPVSAYPVNICIKDNKGNFFVGGAWANVGLEKTFYLNGALNDYTAIPNNGNAAGAVKISSTGSYVEAYVPRQSGVNIVGAEIFSMDMDFDRYQLYLGGSFVAQPTSVANTTNLLRICRVSATSGTVDATFNTQYDATFPGFRSTRTAAASTTANVNSVKYDPIINKVYCGGDFRGYNGATASRIIRLNSNGQYDYTFNVGSASTNGGFNNSVKIIEVDRTGGANDGKVYVGGDFTSYRGTTQSRLVRLNTDGSLDSTFNVGTGPNSTVRKIIVMSDGSLFISGSFTSYNDTSTSYVCRVNTDGTIDNSFSTGSGFQYAGLNDFTSTYTGSPTINNIKYDPAGKLYVLGSFAMYRGVTKNCIVRLNMDGSIDETFNDNGYGAQNIGTGLTDLVLI